MYTENRIITGINKASGQREELSSGCSLKTVLTYLNMEYKLYKKYPGGLYHDYHSIKVIVKKF